MIRRMMRAIARWNHQQHVKDLAHTIAYFEQMAIRLPGEVRRLRELQRFHQGRAATLDSPRNAVNYRIGR